MSDLGRISSQRHPNTVHRPEKIHQQRHGRALGPLEQERRAGFRKHALCDFARFQNRVDFRADPFELAALLNFGKEFLQITERHSETPSVGAVSDRAFLVWDRDVSNPGQKTRGRETAPTVTQIPSIERPE